MEILCLHQSVPVTHKPVFSICDYCFRFGRLFTEILQMVEVPKEHTNSSVLLGLPVFAVHTKTSK